MDATTAEPAEPAELLGPLLRRLRLGADLTLEGLSELSGVSDRTISDIERGASLGPQRRTVELLADALGLDDAGRGQLLAAARAGRHRQPPGGTAGAPLPRSVADFTGRDPEVATVTAHVSSAARGRPAPVAVVCGPPGFGKTSLAIRVGTGTADSFDEVHFVDLRGFDAHPLDAHGVLTRLIHAVTGQPGPVPPHVDQAAALWQTVLSERRVLVILDNAATEDQVRPAIPATGPAAVVVTSRRPLAGLEDVERVFLDQLATDDAVELLRRIVPASQTDGQDLTRLAALCGHVPLALRIAGNRLASRQSWTADDLAARLAGEDRRMDALRAGDLEVRPVIALSYDRLSLRGRQAFRRLALLRSSTFGTSVAGRLIPADLVTAEDTLDELADLGLLQPAAQGRYHLHDLLRLYAQERFGEEESPEARARHDLGVRDWLLHVTIDAGRWFEPGYETAPAVPDPLVDLSTIELADAWLRTEVDHWYAALQEAAAAGEHQLVIDVAESLHWFSDLWAHWGHWYDVYSLGTAAARALGDDEVLATQLGYLAWTELHTRSDPDAGRTIALEARSVAQRAGSVLQEGWATYYAAWAEALLGRFDEALEHCTQSRALMTVAEDPDGTLQALRLVGNVLRLSKRLPEALANEMEVVAWLAEPTNGFSRQVARFTAAASYAEQSMLRVDMGHWDEAIVAADEALRLVDQQEQTRIRALAHTSRAYALIGLGRPADARRDLEIALPLREVLGDAARLEALRTLLAELPE